MTNQVAAHQDRVEDHSQAVQNREDLKSPYKKARFYGQVLGRKGQGWFNSCHDCPFLVPLRGSEAVAKLKSAAPGDGRERSRRTVKRKNKGGH